MNCLYVYCVIKKRIFISNNDLSVLYPLEPTPPFHPHFLYIHVRVRVGYVHESMYACMWNACMYVECMRVCGMYAYKKEE